MASNQLYLFKDRRFLPMFFTQFCGCFNDNLLKSALIMIITYKATLYSSIPDQLLILLANAIFILPYVIFAGLAGQLADKFDKAYLVKIIKIIEIGIVGISIYGFWENSLIFLFISIGLMGIHSTFFGPIKYSILPEHLKKEELLAANGYVEAGTFISILIGTLLGGYAVGGVNLILALMAIVAVLGLFSSFYILPSTNLNPDLEINKNIFKETINIIKYSTSKKQVFLAILGISWFWFIGAALMSQIPTLTRDIFAADQTVANLFLAVFSIGVGVGSFLCNRLLHNEITTKYVFIAALGISVFGIDLFFASGISEVNHEPAQLRGILSFLSKKHNWRILVDLFFIAMLGGLYIVPLFAVMQYFSSPVYRSRVIAANNVINALFMIASTLMLSILFNLGHSVKTAILVISLLNIVVAIYIHELLPENRLIPEPILRGFLKFIFDKMYRVEVKGLENFEKAGKRAVIIANHISYLDPPLLAVYLPERITFAINTAISQEWWIKPILKVARTFPVDPNNAMAMKNLITEVKRNKKIAIFPEGRISITGSLMKIYEGPGMIADKAEANILPIRIDGPQYTHFSKLKNLPRIKLFPKVTITILPPVKIEAPVEADSRQRRKYISHRLYDIMTEMMFESSGYKQPLFQSLIDAGKQHRFNTNIIQDIETTKVTYRQLLMRSFILGELISKETQENEKLGVMLPNSCGAVITFFGMQAFDRIPAMINFTSGAASIISACKTTNVKILYTSKRFIEKAELQEVIEKIAQHIEVRYLEELRAKLTLSTKLKGMIASYFPQFYYDLVSPEKDYKKPAVILFTSGTEGHPKAVVLSHQNIQANRCQVAARVDFGNQDTAFNALPMFHCFGLTAGTLLTTLAGVRTFFYPSPLHYRIIPEIIYDIGATIMFGTDTFLNGYSKFAHAYDFYSIRYIFAGAEKLKPETRNFWFNKYGVRIFEGYGVTEASPVIAVNTPMHDKPGTVGRLIPKMDAAILPVEGISEGGRLCVKGPNVMLGYMKNDNPGVIVPPNVEKLGEGWYDTGDIVTIDDDGFVIIKGRAKRFAKIAGEMVPLTLVEELASEIDKNDVHAVVHISDEKKGEQIFLFTQSKLVTRETMLDKIKERSLTELLLPKNIIYLDEVPVLATGKIDYRSLLAKAEELGGN